MQWGCAALRLSRALCLLLSAPLCPQVSARSPPCPSGACTQSGECCSSCPPGFGAVVPCDLTDTQCEPCAQNHTFSALSSAVEPCQPCRLWQEGYGAVQSCSPERDTECQPCPRGSFSEECCPASLAVSPAKEGPAYPKTNRRKPPKENSTGPTASATSASTFVPPLPEDVGQNIIPVYCSLLAAVVVGLLAYVAFKCWHTCRQKQQLAKARAAELGTAAEGEKLHSDSGVFLDTHSLQEPHQTGKAPRLEARPYSSVPQQRREEVERLLESGGPSGDWRGLAARLGYGDEAIGTFARGQAPARTLLATWAATEGATVEALCLALAAMGRQDVAECLAGPGDASSMV
ncbi:death domain-containing membrane protein NRADD-like [Meleagris gallopavo]|uniref:death domain-containing membrane protein NRADD-like n=1 Tax=Meleagris gallopavo TaxID=9103 RepID=UPI00093DECAE|nr:death domain-containing membrane protein NRADD-like [Meleagris gallopavo]